MKSTFYYNAAHVVHRVLAVTVTKNLYILLFSTKRMYEMKESPNATGGLALCLRDVAIRFVADTAA